MFRSLVKLLILGVILAAGIIFISDGFMYRVGEGVSRIERAVRGEAEKRLPAINQDFSAQTQETKTEIGNLYQNISWSAWNNFKNWAWQEISGVWQNFGK